MVKIGYKPRLKYDQILRLILALHRLELSEFKRLRGGGDLHFVFFFNSPWSMHLPPSKSSTFANWQPVCYCFLSCSCFCWSCVASFHSDPQKKLPIRFWLFGEKALDPKCRFVHHLFLTVSAAIIPPSK